MLDFPENEPPVDPEQLDNMLSFPDEEGQLSGIAFTKVSFPEDEPPVSDKVTSRLLYFREAEPALHELQPLKNHKLSFPEREPEIVQK